MNIEQSDIDIILSLLNRPVYDLKLHQVRELIYFARIFGLSENDTLEKLRNAVIEELRDREIIDQSIVKELTQTVRLPSGEVITVIPTKREAEEVLSGAVPFSFGKSGRASNIGEKLLSGEYGSPITAEYTSFRPYPDSRASRGSSSRSSIGSRASRGSSYGSSVEEYPATGFSFGGTTQPRNIGEVFLSESGEQYPATSFNFGQPVSNIPGNIYSSLTGASSNVPSSSTTPIGFQFPQRRATGATSLYGGLGDIASNIIQSVPSPNNISNALAGVGGDLTRNFNNIFG